MSEFTYVIILKVSIFSSRTGGPSSVCVLIFSTHCQTVLILVDKFILTPVVVLHRENTGYKYSFPFKKFTHFYEYLVILHHVLILLH